MKNEEKRKSMMMITVMAGAVARVRFKEGAFVEDLHFLGLDYDILLL